MTMTKIKRTDNNNGQNKKDCYCLSFLLWPLLLSVLLILAIVIVCPFYFGHGYCLSFLFWPLLLSVLFILAIVIVCPFYHDQNKKNRQ
jgi:glucan phosphoethanolaminetransferase (alkaline phosphatase superfamily)